MRQRLQKILSDGGVASRRAAERMITHGRVLVNGKAAAVGSSADPEVDIIEVDGVPLKKPAGKLYIALNKPRGYVTTVSDELGRRGVTELVALDTRIYPVGRLDINSEGLLIMTNDGDFANRVMHPSHGVSKDYLVWAEGHIDAAIPRLRAMTHLGPEPINPVTVEKVKEFDVGAIMLMTLTEGKNRQIRRMCKSVGISVARLRRTRIGAVTLGGLPAGKWRYLTASEVSYFLAPEPLTRN